MLAHLWALFWGSPTLPIQAEEKMSEGADQEQEIQEETHPKEGRDDNYEEEEEEEEEGGVVAAKAHRRGEMWSLVKPQSIAWQIGICLGDQM